MRLIGADGNMVGIVPIEQAREAAEEAGMDLVLIANNPDNPVARIMDYGKYVYEQEKRDKEARKNQVQIELKEVGLKLTTEEHDLQVKVRNAIRFLEAGDRVKVSIRFRGREMAHQSQGYDVMRDFADRLKDYGVVDRAPRVEGRFMNMFLSPNTDKDKKK